MEHLVGDWTSQSNPIRAILRAKALGSFAKLLRQRFTLLTQVDPIDAQAAGDGAMWRSRQLRAVSTTKKRTSEPRGHQGGFLEGPIRCCRAPAR